MAIMKNQLYRKGELSHSLGLSLLRVQLPPVNTPAGEKQSSAEMQEKISLMEQVLSQLSAIHEGGWHTWLYGKLFFAMEIAVPHIGQEVQFYFAVPRRYAPQVEKMITGVYPQAHIEQVKDYTVFYPSGVSAAAVAVAQSKILPFKTYQTLSADPLGSLLNSFSKVANEGEGLALQVVASHADRSWNGTLNSVSANLQKGLELNKAVSEATKSLIFKWLGSGNKKKDPAAAAPIVNDSLVKMVQAKAQKPLFNVNLRIVAAAQSAERVETLVQELSAPFTQFSNEGVNRFTFKKAVKRGLQKLIYRFSFRLPEGYGSLILSTDEIASFFHLPNTPLGITHFATVKAKTAGVPLNIPKEGLMLGVNSFRGVDTSILMAGQDRARHLYVIGQTGTGKSVFLRNLVQQDIEQGHGALLH